MRVDNSLTVGLVVDAAPVVSVCTERYQEWFDVRSVGVLTEEERALRPLLEEFAGDVVPASRLAS